MLLIWLWFFANGLLSIVGSILRIQVICPNDEILRQSIMKKQEGDVFHVKCVNQLSREFLVIWETGEKIRIKQ